MKLNPSSIIKFLLLLIVAGGLLFFAFRGMSIDKIIQGMLEANFFWLLLSVIISIAALVSRAYRWKLLIEPLGYSPLLRRTFYALMVGYFANLAIPRLGEITRCGSLNKTESVPFSSLLGTVIVERAVDVISLLICMLLTVIIEYKRLGNYLNDKIINPIGQKLKYSFTSPLVIISIIVFITIAFLAVRYFRKKAKQKDKEKGVSHFIKELIKGLKSIAYLKRPWQFIFHSVLIWVLYYFSGYVAFFALPTIHLGPGAALFILTLGGVAMSAPVQGGIGVYHLLVSEGLMLYGLSHQDGLTFATLVHASQMAVVVLFGSVSLFLLFLENKKNTISIRKGLENK